MSLYFMFGNYSQKSIKEISSERTEKSIALIEKNGGKLVGGYALMGDKDLVLIVDLPSTEKVMQTSVALSKMLGIGFSTSPAVTIETFDKLLKDL